MLSGVHYILVSKPKQAESFEKSAYLSMCYRLDESVPFDLLFDETFGIKASLVFLSITYPRVFIRNQEMPILITVRRAMKNFRTSDMNVKSYFYAKTTTAINYEKKSIYC